MDFHCNACGYDFFMEEGYDSNADVFVCPMCGAIDDGYCIKEVM